MVRASQQLLRKDSPSILALLRHQEPRLTQDWSRCCGALMKTLGRPCCEEPAILTEERGPLKQSLGPKMTFRRSQWFIKSLERGTGIAHRGGRHTGSALASLPTRSHPLIPNDCSSAELFLFTWFAVRATGQRCFRVFPRSSMHSYPALSYVFTMCDDAFPPSHRGQKQHRGWAGTEAALMYGAKIQLLVPLYSVIVIRDLQVSPCPQTSYEGDGYTSWKNSARVRIMSPEPQAVCHRGLGSYLGTPCHFYVC